LRPDLSGGLSSLQEGEKKSGGGLAARCQYIHADTFPPQAKGVLVGGGEGITAIIKKFLKNGEDHLQLSWS